MKYNALFEKTPVIYGEIPVKLRRFTRQGNRPVFNSLHWHDRLELLILDAGEMQLQLAGQEISAKTGDIVVINCSATHMGTAGAQGVTYRVVMLELLEPFAHNETIRRMLLPYHHFGAAFLPVVRDAALQGMIDALFAAAEKKPIGYELTVTGLCYQILGALLERHGDGDYVRLTEDRRLEEIISYIEGHFQEPITTAGISSRFGYDKAYFCRRFKEITGLTPTTYIRILRLENARRLLKEPGMTVAAAAAASGFPDQNYFSRCFKAQYGKSPTAYKKSRT